MNEIKNNNIFAVLGNNFSGRSESLKTKCTNNGGVYIGEIPSNYLSGVSPTVMDELNLFSSKSSITVKKAVNNLISKLNFNRLKDNNPFLLSGGEQVMLTILSSILLEPKLIAIDTAIEQLSTEWNELLFKLILDKLKHQKFLLSDNRIKEYEIPFKEIEFKSLLKDRKYNFSKPSMIKFKNGTLTESVTISNLSFEYQIGMPILKNINLKLEAGNIYFLKGINGVGKSTLAKILSGILQVKKGFIKLNEKKYNPYKIPGTLFGYSFQNPDEQLFSRTVSNEILSFKKIEDDVYSNRREIFLKMFGIDKIRDIHPADLPFVMRKRVALAATLAYDRPWYIIDEPTIGQDDEFNDFLFSLFTYLKSIGKGIIIISHSLSFISKFQSKILYLNNGSLKIN